MGKKEWKKFLVLNNIANLFLETQTLFYQTHCATHPRGPLSNGQIIVYAPYPFPINIFYFKTFIILLSKLSEPRLKTF